MVARHVTSAAAKAADADEVSTWHGIAEQATNGYSSLGFSSSRIWLLGHMCSIVMRSGMRWMQG